MYGFVFHACDGLVAIAPRKLRYQLDDRSLKVCSVDLDSTSSAVMVYY